MLGKLEIVGGRDEALQIHMYGALTTGSLAVFSRNYYSLNVKRPPTYSIITNVRAYMRKGEQLVSRFAPIQFIIS